MSKLRCGRPFEELRWLCNNKRRAPRTQHIWVTSDADGVRWMCSGRGGNRALTKLAKNIKRSNGSNNLRVISDWRYRSYTSMKPNLNIYCDLIINNFSLFLNKIITLSWLCGRCNATLLLFWNELEEVVTHCYGKWDAGRKAAGAQRLRVERKGGSLLKNRLGCLGERSLPPNKCWPRFGNNRLYLRNGIRRRPRPVSIDWSVYKTAGGGAAARGLKPSEAASGLTAKRKQECRLIGEPWESTK